MLDFNFKKYVFNKRAEGLNDKQIATMLGMSLKHFISKLKGEETEETPKTEVVEPVMTTSFMEEIPHEEPIEDLPKEVRKPDIKKTKKKTETV